MLLILSDTSGHVPDPWTTNYTKLTVPGTPSAAQKRLIKRDTSPLNTFIILYIIACVLEQLQERF